MVSTSVVDVTDYYNSRIQKFDSNGTFITKWGSQHLTNPFGIAVDSSGKVYVTDTGNSSVQVFAPFTNSTSK
jgi:DNA-binding beta-propeller fold protein YncE